MIARAFLLVAVVTISSGCGAISSGISSMSGISNVAYISDTNYIRFEHPFTDAAASDVRRRAGELCAARKQVAIKTTSVCSLTKCTTNYQCMDSADAAKYGQ